MYNDDFIPLSLQHNTLNEHEPKLETWMLDIISKDSWNLSWCTCEICHSKCIKKGEDSSLCTKQDADCRDNLQKKIMPWTTMFLYDDLLEITEESNSRTSKGSQNDLIVVASLIDKIPNLGGLCRSCEIFGVGSYVIGSKKYCDNKEFQTLSVTSDK